MVSSTTITNVATKARSIVTKFDDNTKNFWAGNGASNAKDWINNLAPSDARAAGCHLPVIGGQINIINDCLSKVATLQTYADMYVADRQLYDEVRLRERNGETVSPSSMMVSQQMNEHRTTMNNYYREIRTSLNSIRTMSKHSGNSYKESDSYSINTANVRTAVIPSLNEIKAGLEDTINGLNVADYDDQTVSYAISNYQEKTITLNFSNARTKIVNNINNIINSINEIEKRLETHIENHIAFENNEDVTIVTDSTTTTAQSVETTTEINEQYTVKRGDTLSRIASKYGLSWQELYEANKGVIGNNPGLIEAGQVLKIPGVTTTTTTTQTVVSDKEVVTSDAFEDNILPPKYEGSLSYEYVKNNSGYIVDSLNYEGEIYEYDKQYELTEEDIEMLAYVCKREQGTPEGAAWEASLILNLYEKNGSKYKSVADYVKRSGWFASRSTGSTLSDPNYTNVVEDVINNGNRVLPYNIDEHDYIGDITSATNNGVAINPRDRSQYIPNVTVIHNKYGSTYTFYGFAPNNGDPFGYINPAKDV